MTVTQRRHNASNRFRWNGNDRVERPSEREKERMKKEEKNRQTIYIRVTGMKSIHIFMCAHSVREHLNRAAHFVHVYTFPIIIYEDQATEYWRKKKTRKNSTRRNDETNDERKRKTRADVKSLLFNECENKRKKNLLHRRRRLLIVILAKSAANHLTHSNRKIATPLQPINFFRLLNNNKYHSHTQPTTQLFLFMVRSKISFVLFCCLYSFVVVAASVSWAISV